MERPLPEYEEDFGHEIEEVVMDVLTKRGLIVEAVEKGTKVEDIRNKVDFWLKLRGMDQPIGIQYTVTGSEEKIASKMKQLKDRSHQAQKETPGTLGWSGKTDLILIKGDKKRLGDYYNKSLKMGVSPAEVVGDEFVRGFFEQLLRQLGEFNPIKARVLVNALQEELKRQKKEGRK